MISSSICESWMIKSWIIQVTQVILWYACLGLFISRSELGFEVISHCAVSCQNPGQTFTPALCLKKTVIKSAKTLSYNMWLVCSEKLTRIFHFFPSTSLPTSFQQKPDWQLIAIFSRPLLSFGSLQSMLSLCSLGQTMWGCISCMEPSISPFLSPLPQRLPSIALSLRPAGHQQSKYSFFAQQILFKERFSQLWKRNFKKEELFLLKHICSGPLLSHEIALIADSFLSYPKPLNSYGLSPLQSRRNIVRVKLTPDHFSWKWNANNIICRAANRIERERSKVKYLHQASLGTSVWGVTTIAGNKPP